MFWCDDVQTEELEGRPRSQPDDLINFRQLRSNALQAAELDIYDGDDIRSVFCPFITFVGNPTLWPLRSDGSTGVVTPLMGGSIDRPS